MDGTIPRLDALSAQHPSVFTKLVVPGAGDGLTISSKTIRRNADYTSSAKRKAEEIRKKTYKTKSLFLFLSLPVIPVFLIVLSLTCLNFLLIATGYAVLQFKALNLSGN